MKIQFNKQLVIISLIMLTCFAADFFFGTGAEGYVLGVFTASFVTVANRWSRPNDAANFDGNALLSLATPIPYAATLEVPAPYRQALVHHIEFAPLTGALTLNGTNINPSAAGAFYRDGDEVNLYFNSVAGATVTFGTNIRSAGTAVVPANGVGIVKCRYYASKLNVIAQLVAVA